MLVVALLLTAARRALLRANSAPPTPRARTIRRYSALPLPRGGDGRDLRQGARSCDRAADRTHPQGGVTGSWQRTTQRRTVERPASLAARGRIRIVQLLRAVPIRWRILSIAALNSAVVRGARALIWNGAKVLGSAWEDVRQVRESDKILAMLESETSRLQNLIHRYINQPSPELFAEILLLREAVLGTLTTRASTDPMLSGSVEELERVTDRFLNGFGELRAVQATISKTYEEQVLGPARDMAGLYSIIEGATGHRDALIWPSLGKSREAFTAMLVAANAYYLSLATASAEDARRNTETIEKTIPVMIRPRRQRPAAHGAGAAEGADHGAARGLAETHRAARQPHRTAAQHHRRQPGRRHRRDRRSLGQDAPARAEGAGDVRPYAGRHLAPGAVDRGDLPRHHPLRRRADRALDPPAAAADHDGDARDHAPAITTAACRAPAPRTRSAPWRARWRCSARTPSPSARPRTSCAPPRRRPRARCSNSTPPSRT